MGWFADLRIRTKLLAGFGLICALLVGQAIVAWRAIADIEDIERNEVDAAARADAAVRQLRSDENRVRGSMLGYLLYTDADERAAFKRDVEERMEAVDRGIEAVRSFLTAHAPGRPALGKEIARLTGLEKALAAARQGRARQFELVAAGRIDEALALGTGEQTELFERGKASRPIQTLEEAIPLPVAQPFTV